VPSQAALLLRMRNDQRLTKDPFHVAVGWAAFTFALITFTRPRAGPRTSAAVCRKFFRPPELSATSRMVRMQSWTRGYSSARQHIVGEGAHRRQARAARSPISTAGSASAR